MKYLHKVSRFGHRFASRPENILHVIQRGIEMIMSNHNSLMTNYNFLLNTSAPCGISLLSSYALGIGSVMAINQRIEVKGHSCADKVNGNLFPQLFKTAKEIIGIDPELPLKISTYSQMPSGAGLKTSSAVITALNAALIETQNKSYSQSDLIELSNAVAREANLTQAGSVDDNFATFLGGVVVTQTKGSELLARWEIPTNLKILIAVPPKSFNRSHYLNRSVLLKPYRKKIDKLISRLFNKNDLFSVMSESAFIHCEALGYSVLPLQTALDAGAMGVSLSGKGPALVALTNTIGNFNAIKRLWQQILPFGTRFIAAQPENTGLQTSFSDINKSIKKGEKYAYSNVEKCE